REVESLIAFVLHGTASLERERAIRRMCELGEEIGEADQVLRGLMALSNLYYHRGEPVQGLELSRRCLELADAAQDAGPLNQTRLNLGLLAFSCGKLREAVSSFEEGWRTLDRTTRRVSRRVFYRSGFACGLALAFHLLGRIGEAVKL